MKVKRIFGQGVKVILALVVFAFLGLHSLRFFEFTFPPDQWYYAYLGFGLTGGGVVGYLVLMMTGDADTDVKKAVTLAMLVVSVLGELATAGFGMQVEAWKAANLSLSPDDFQFMVLAVQALGLAHGLALIAYVAGDKIGEALADDDGDGTPNIIDRDYKRKPRPQMEPARSFNSETEADPTKPSPR